MLKDLLDTLSSLLELNDATRLVAALPCVAALLGSKQHFEAVEMRLLPRPSTESLTQKLMALATSSKPRPVRVEALNAVGCASNYFSAIATDWQQLLGVAPRFATERDDQVQHIRICRGLKAENIAGAQRICKAAFSFECRLCIHLRG